MHPTFRNTVPGSHLATAAPHRPTAGQVHRPAVIERNVRLATGLTLFAYAACHFASHATGLFGLRAIDAVGRGILLAPWQNGVGHVVLFGALFVHAGLGLRALWRRRHLRIPAAEAWQLGLGLLIPFLMIPHAANVRLGAVLYGLDDTYYRLLYQYWLTPPASGLVRQFTLLFAVWVHGCVGLHFWLRYRAWYGRWQPALLGAACLLPMLAVLGLVNAGWSTVFASALDPGFAAAHGPPRPGTPKARQIADLKALWGWLQYAYAALIGLILALRLGRNRRARSRSAVRITYPDGRRVSAPRGFSVLEASRWARIPHASVCGGRGRCSTCRVRVTAGLSGLAPPSAAEQETLARIKAPPSVRLACQLRPDHDIAVAPLLPTANALARGLRIAVDEVRELQVTALAVDLRDSTHLAANRLPFDALFILDRYVQRVTAAVHAHGGLVTSVAGDGVMAVFGVGPGESAGAGAANALRAALAIWESLDRLSDELREEIGRPLAFGMGLHSGVSAVGAVSLLGRPTVQFLGNTGNIAARLEALTKELGCTLIVSEAVLDTAGHGTPEAISSVEVRVRGHESQPYHVLLLRTRDEARRAAGADLVHGRP
jgi:adenylate cyclase